MKKNVINILVDALSFVVFLAMVSTGLILNFILPPGSGRVERLMRGSGRREQTIELFMGLARHEWGTIHFYIAMTFLGFLIIHLYLHWTWIKAVSFGTKDRPQPLSRKLMAAIILVLMILSLVFPWLPARQTMTRTEFTNVRHP
jgi:hypothetical protein